MAYFPFFIELNNKKIVIFGGGLVAYRKVLALLEFDADIYLVAPTVCEDIEEQRGKIHIILDEYKDEYLEDSYCVIAATNHPEVNSRIAKDCRNKKILVNVVDELKECDFLFPSYLKRGSISVGITTSGKSPVMAGKIRKILEEKLPDYYTELVDTLGNYRDFIKREVSTEALRAELFKELAELGIHNKGIVTIEDVEALVRKYEAKEDFRLY